MALVPFPGPQSGALQLPPDDDDDDVAGRQDVVSGASRRAPETHHPRRASASPSASSSGFFFIQHDLRLSSWRRRCAALPAGQQADLHAAGRSLLALHHSLADHAASCSPRRSSCIRSGCSSRRACTRTRSGSRSRSCCFSTLGFLAGAAFNHYVAFPFMMMFFASFNTPDLRSCRSSSDVFGLYTKMLLGMGIIFQMPTVVFFLAKMKMVTARFLVKQFQVRVPDHLHRRGRDHADRRPDDAGDLRRADARPLPPQHRHRLDRRAQAAQGATVRA